MTAEANTLPQAAPDAFATWWQSRSQLAEFASEWSGKDGSDEDLRVQKARVLCSEVVKALWDQRTGKNRKWWRPWRTNGASVNHAGRRIARNAASALATVSDVEASYLVGTLYTALLPNKLRASLGAYYTPPVLAERLLDIAATEGVDYSTVTALDPACGGGAFLAPLARRILNDHRIQCLSPEEQLIHIERHLAGIEIDGFAAWLSRAFLQLIVMPQSTATDRAIDANISEGNTLEILTKDTRKFDLIIGNPPYGRTGLTKDQREYFERSLFGHANLYGIFLDAALRWRRDSGLVAFLTPTSFLGGQYFMKLRDLLIDEAPPLVIDFVEERKGVFDSVLQETCLTVFGPNPAKTSVVHLLGVGDRALRAHRAGTFEINGAARGAPWLLPRTVTQSELIGKASTMRGRLHLLGFKASTGPLVWNRHKNQLRKKATKGTYPLIWAEAVRANRFNFVYKSRADAPFCEILEGQSHLVVRDPCVLVQRTTAKEQRHRLIACAVPQSFIDKWGGIVVENHVNVLRASPQATISSKALAAVLNTSVIDQVFRCLSGSVAVSATELHALPLPSNGILSQVEKVAQDDDVEKMMDRIERIMKRAYGGKNHA